MTLLFASCDFSLHEAGWRCLCCQTGNPSPFIRFTRAIYFSKRPPTPPSEAFWIFVFFPRFSFASPCLAALPVAFPSPDAFSRAGKTHLGLRGLPVAYYPLGFLWAWVGFLNPGPRADFLVEETHAYKIGEMSLCAPFLAFDPVIQLLSNRILRPPHLQPPASNSWPCAFTPCLEERTGGEGMGGNHLGSFWGSLC